MPPMVVVPLEEVTLDKEVPLDEEMLLEEVVPLDEVPLEEVRP
jgi:hypothetical protein